jgi:hypothetical protein
VGFLPLACNLLQFWLFTILWKTTVELETKFLMKRHKFYNFSFDNSIFHAAQNSFCEMKNNLVSNMHI